MIVDGYCDVCGSPAGAAPYVPAAASAASSAPADEPGATVARASTPAPASNGRKEFTEGEPDGAQDYRTRVEEAQLPDDVREAALCEVGKLERTGDQSPESGDIRTWLDTILDLPWTTKTADWMDIHESREVEATLQTLIKPAVTDIEDAGSAEAQPAAAELEDADTAEVQPAATELQQADTVETEPAAAELQQADTTQVQPAATELQQTDTTEVEPAATELQQADTTQVQPAATELQDADTAQVQPAAADLVKAATAPAGTHDDGTVVMAAVGGRHPLPQPPEQRVLEREPVQTPAKKRRIGYLALAATVLAALLIGALLFAASRDRGVTAESVPTLTATTTKPTSEPTIQLKDFPDSARPFRTIRIEGTYPSGPDRFLQVQRWEGGEWLTFPYPAKTDKSGRFTAFVELGQPGRYRIHLLDPDSGVTSKTFVLVIKG